MLKRFFKGLKLHAQTPLTLLISTLLLFVVGLGFLCFIMILVEEEDGWIPLGSLLALVSLVIFTVVNYMNYPREFMLALSLGQTRKEFLLSHVIGRLLWTTLAYGVVLLLTWLECGLCRFLFSQTEEVFALMPILTDGRVILTAIPALVLLEMFCGALYSRFGKPVNVVIYILWMSLAMSVSQWAHRIVPVFQGLAAFWIPLGIIGMSVMAFVVIYLGRNQGVR